LKDYIFSTNINLIYDGNRNAFIETNWLTPRRVRTLTIIGTEGTINVEYTTQQLTVENEDRITQPLLPYKDPFRKRYVHSPIASLGGEESEFQFTPCD